jgi:NAD-dependent deacetylase
MRGKVPNAAHHAMAALQSPERSVWIATQNIDELHQRAGSRNVFELHGNLRRIICTACRFSEHWETFEPIAELPLCPQCQAILRPDVVLYGESLPVAVMDAFFREQKQGFDLVFSVGTTSLFQYVIEPVVAAIQSGIPVVEINPEATSLSEWVSFRLAAPAGSTLQRLTELAADGRGSGLPF